MLKRINVFTLLGLLLSGVFTVPAFAAEPSGGLSDAVLADPADEERPTVFKFPGKGKKVNGRTVDTIICTTVPSPRPTLGGGGTNVQWGAVINCDVPGELSLYVYLVQWEGGAYYFQDDVRTEHAVGWTLWNGKQSGTPCVGFSPTNWQVRFIPTYDGAYGTPPEGSSSIRQLNCE